MSDGKAAISSKTIWGGVIAILGSLTGPAAAQIMPELPPEWQTVISGLVSALGGLLAIYGRTSASAPITGVLKPK